MSAKSPRAPVEREDASSEMGGASQRVTPAMEAGIADHIWDWLNCSPDPPVCFVPDFDGIFVSLISCFRGGADRKWS